MSVEPQFEGDFVLEEEFPLDSGGVLRRPVLHYALYGELNASRDNAVFVAHALSGSARVGDWWPDLFREGGLLDLSRECVLGINILGSCYGSTGPASVDAETGRPYGPRFPLVGIGDNVRLQARLLDWLGIGRLRLVLGASIGGMQGLEWAVRFPERVERVVSIAAATVGAMGLGLNHLQRELIRMDPEWRGGEYAVGAGPVRGLGLARGLAVCSYKSAELFEERFGRRPDRSGEDPFSDVGGRFDVAGYLDHQGEKFVGRFDANSYMAISRMMDTFDPARGFGSAAEAYGRIRAAVTLVGISSDWLFPAADVRALAEELVAAGVSCRYVEMVSGHGHDAFLAEPRELVRLLRG